MALLVSRTHFKGGDRPRVASEETRPTGKPAPAATHPGPHGQFSVGQRGPRPPAH